MLDVNPWVKIWTSPKITIQKIVNYNPSYQFGLLCFIYGLLWCLSMAQTLMLGHYYSVTSLLIISALLASPIGFVFMSISTGFFYLAGKLFRGTADFKNVRAVVAWANVPSLIALVTWAVLVGRYGSDIFITASPDVSGAFSLGDFCMILQTIAAVWSMVVLIAGIAQVQHFSNLRAVGSFIVVTALWLLVTFVFLYGMMMTQQSKLAFSFINLMIQI